MSSICDSLGEKRAFVAPYETHERIPRSFRVFVYIGVEGRERERRHGKHIVHRRRGGEIQGLQDPERPIDTRVRKPAERDRLPPHPLTKTFRLSN
jgi:hypothetical protein